MRIPLVALVSMVTLACNLEIPSYQLEGGSEASGGNPTGPNAGPTLPGDAPTDALEWEGFRPVCASPLDFPGEGGAGGAGGLGTDAAASTGPRLGTGDLTVLLVFDKSGSMSARWEDRTRWEAASDAFLKGLEGVEEEVTVGSLVFPQGDHCSVAPLYDSRQIQFQSGTNFIERWNATEAMSEPSGSTPLGLAFRRADEAIEEAEACGLLDERRFRVVVVTDGEPNCGTSEYELVQYAQKWRDKGIEVHVLGLPGSQHAANLLDRIAGNGGTEEHVPTDTVRDAEDNFWNLVR